MNKSNPVGVRFNQDVLEHLRKNNLATTPQSALRYFENTYTKTAKNLHNPIESTQVNKPQKTTTQKKVIVVVKKEPKKNDNTIRINEIEELLKAPAKYLPKNKRDKLTKELGELKLKKESQS